jgi:hypothetical protein
MFTPPSSPRPSGQEPTGFHTEDLDDLVNSTSLPYPRDRKRTIGRRTTLAVILVPLVLILITVSTRLFIHPIVFDAFSSAPLRNWGTRAKTTSEWRPHKRQLQTASSNSTLAFPTTSITPSTSVNTMTSTSLVSQQLPTIPASPPVLPTPFPEPFDTSLEMNFTSVNCYNFFLNMTNTSPFRDCRPFSLLLQSSQGFIDVSYLSV